MSLPFEANCLPVAPFALPYADPAAAWAALLRWTPDVLAWPQLPGEPAWQLAAEGFPGRLEQQPLIDRTQFEQAGEALQLAFLRNDLAWAAAPSFARRARSAPWRGGEPAQQRALLISLCGPNSLGLTLVDQDERPLLGNEILREALAQHLRLRAGWLEQEAGDLAAASMICFAEPFWNALHSPFVASNEGQALLLLEECFGSVQGGRGLQAAGVADWRPLLRSSLSLLICPAAERAALLACGPDLNEYFERGGIVAWAMAPEPRATAEALKLEWQLLAEQAMAADILTSRLLVGSLLTLGGEIAQASPAEADAALELLAHAARAVRAHYKLS